MAQDAGPSCTIEMVQVIAETGTGGGGGGGGGSESSGPSDITLEMDQVINETGVVVGGGGGGSESTGTGTQANTTIVIPMVRKQLSVGNENSYTPHYVPIGPYHVRHSFSESEIEEVKLRSVCYLQRLSEQQREGRGLIREELELPAARACYPRMDQMRTTEQWSTMLLHDGCYLLCCMVDYDTPQGTPASSNNNDETASVPTGDDDDHATASRHNNTVVRDTVFLADNQIPFFVLQRIHERVTGDPSSSVLEPIADYVQELLQAKLYISKHRRPAPTTTPSHLLHLVHFYLLPTSPLPQAAKEENAKRPPRTGRWLHATEYCKYGFVSFKPRVFEEDEGWSFLDVRLEGGTLWIPRLRVDNMTWTVLRNLMALEEGKTRKPVTAYCVFMSQVAGTVEDVELLQRQEVLEQFLVNNEEVAKGFANLCNGVVLVIDNDDSNYLKPIWHELRSRCTYWNHCLGSFRQKKCSDPVYQAAFVIAILVFLCELAQVILPLPKVQKHLQ